MRSAGTSISKEENAPAPRRERGARTILAELRRAIETGAYSEGEQLPPERELASSFRAARGTVRRALDQLEQAGLVARRLGSGTFVTARGPATRPDEDYIDLISPLQLIEARAAVEPETTRLAVLNATRRDLDEMQTILVRLEASGDDKDAFSRLDAEFHLAIARASRNPLLIAVYGQINKVRLHAQWDAMRKLILAPGTIAEYHRQHRAIYAAIDGRDAQRAEALVVAHLGKAREDLLKANSR